MENIFTVQDVFSAYKKLKHYYYYDNTSLFIRKRIADFEMELHSNNDSPLFNKDYQINARLEGFFQRIVDIVNGDLDNIKVYIEKNVNYKITPKSFHLKKTDFITNTPESGPFRLDRINIFFDSKIEIHIMSVLWLMYAGRHLTSFMNKNIYAYVLELTSEESDQKIVDGLRLYKPYFIQYQNWRDKALKTANNLLDEKKNVSILGLDIKDYFYSIRLDLEKWRKELFRKDNELRHDWKLNRSFDMLKLINKAFTNKIQEIKILEPKISENESVLPIGLLSSGLLGNLFMIEFDKKVKDILNPAYYGRYVDDLLFVFEDREVDHDKISPINDFINKFFVKRGLLAEKQNILKRQLLNLNYSKIKNTSNNIDAENIKIDLAKKEEEKRKFIIKGKGIEDLECLTIQANKIILEYFDYKESRAAINKFIKNLEKNRSEFRFLPEEDNVESEFDEEAFSIQYSDSKNKLRSIKDFSEDKYGASKYLAKKIFASNLSSEQTIDIDEEQDDKDSSKQILNFFKGLTSLDFHTLWEKVVTYFIINKKTKELNIFINQTLKTINEITYKNCETDLIQNVVEQNLKKNLRRFLEISVAVPLSMNLKFQLDTSDNKNRFFYPNIVKFSHAIRFSNMFRHNLINISCLNFTKILYTKKDLNNLDIKSIHGEHLEIMEILSYLSPRFVHFHELNILKIHETLAKIKGEDIINEVKSINDIPNDAFDNFYGLNYGWRNLSNNGNKDIVNDKINLRNTYFNIVGNAEEKGISKYDINVDTEGGKGINKKIGLANMKVFEENIISNINNHSNTSKERRQTLFQLINLCEKEKCDLFVLPEVSVPFNWIGFLAYQSYKTDTAIIAGLEHFVNKFKFAFNFMATILPIRLNGYTTCLIRIRLKNHYAPEEIKLLKGYRLLLPNNRKNNFIKLYDRFHWRKIYFSVYNCFELADIRDRALFKSEIDFVVASEFNRDVNYFSEIAGSWPRDIHCFFIQVNTSQWGDSRLVQPSSSSDKNLISVKGGENSTVIVGYLAIKELREFQLKEYLLQKDDINNGVTSLKPTPPDFNKTNVEKRINNQ